MICAMGAISLLGFIVWAHLGLLIRENQVIKFCCMLESLYTTNYIEFFYVKMFVEYISLNLISDQSAGNYICFYVLLTRCKKHLNFSYVGACGTVRSSETIRKISVSKFYPNWFIDWFVGFVEGDGSFSCDKSAKRLFFKIRQKDVKILYRIKNYFKFGSVTVDADGYYSYTVYAKNEILVLLYILNGKLVLAHTNERFVNEWLNNFNEWFATSNPILYKGSASFLGMQNAWLCGFTDADGSFGFTISADKKRKHGCRVRVYWYIDLASSKINGGSRNRNTVEATFIDQSCNKHELEAMSIFLGFGYIEKKYLTETSFSPPTSNQGYRLITKSLKDCQSLLDYFELFPPQTTNKKVRFIRWKRVIKWCLDRVWVQRLPKIRHLIKLNQDI
uniref:LAGLIDADG endonuclease n=1 Tax=Eudorina elegans TaxID=47282 RepID=A0A6M9TTD5_9CHLO|nr:LAGLIDADG endonuclease [Eudorina elegans]